MIPSSIGCSIVESPGSLGIGRFGGGPAGLVCAAEERRRCESGEVLGTNEDGAADEGPAPDCERPFHSREL